MGSIWPPQQQRSLHSRHLLQDAVINCQLQHHQPEALLIYLIAEENSWMSISTVFPLFSLGAATTGYSRWAESNVLTLGPKLIIFFNQVFILGSPPLPSWAQVQCLWAVSDLKNKQTKKPQKTLLKIPFTSLLKVHCPHNKFCLEFCSRNTLSIRKLACSLSVEKDN